MKIVAIGGMPGTGKTTLMKRLLEELGPFNKCCDPKFPLVPFHYNDKFVILGKYTDSADYAQGTDKMSMAVQPEAVGFLTMLAETKPNHSLLYEGDRLFNGSFIALCSDLAGDDLRVVVLKADDELLQERYDARGSDQNETWLKGRRSKLSTITSNMELMPNIRRFQHETLEDQDKVVEHIKGFLNVDSGS